MHFLIVHVKLFEVIQMKSGADMQKKQKSTFQKITMVLVWIMIIATLGSLVASALQAIGMFG